MLKTNLQIEVQHSKSINTRIIPVPDLHILQATPE